MKVTLDDLVVAAKENKLDLREVEIIIEMPVGCCGDCEILDVEDFEADRWTFQGTDKQYIKIYIDTLAGYFSCRQMAHTIDTAKKWGKDK